MSGSRTDFRGGMGVLRLEKSVSHHVCIGYPRRGIDTGWAKPTVVMGLFFLKPQEKNTLLLYVVSAVPDSVA